jgi:uncharacterized protein
MQPEQLTFHADGRSHTALLLAPPDAQWLYVFAHGAGAGMRHPFMGDVALEFARRGIASLRWEFPYMAAGSRRPDPAPVLEATVRAVVDWAAATLPGLRLLAGGKSMGGRMTSRACAAEPLPRVEALLFTGFPLHAAGRPGTERADHLQQVQLPMLFLQGTRDALADPSLMRDVCNGLGSRATHHMLEGADHGFAVLKRSGRTRADVLAELADTAAAWIEQLPAAHAP